MYITQLAVRNYTFSSQTQKGCDLVPVLCINPQAAQHNLVLGYTLTSLLANPELTFSLLYLPK